MVVKVTMDDVLNFRGAAEFIYSAHVPLKAAYKINKIKKKIEEEFNFYSEKFQEIVNTYARKDEEGNIVYSDDGDQILIKEGTIDECNTALEDLHNLTIEIDNLDLTIDDLGDIECTPDELEAIMPFLS